MTSRGFGTSGTAGHDAPARPAVPVQAGKPGGQGAVAPTAAPGKPDLSQITRQASIIAYANDFKLMMGMTLLAFPLIFLIRTSRHDFAESR